MSILIQLGANHTLFIQFAIFVFTVSFLTIYVFGPYFKARDQRLEKTKGGEELAQEASKKAQTVKQTYETEARSLTAQIKAIFDAEKNQAQQEADVILSKAKSESGKIVEENRSRLATTVAHVASELSKQAPQLSKNIKEKLIG